MHVGPQLMFEQCTFEFQRSDGGDRVIGIWGSQIKTLLSGIGVGRWPRQPPR